MTDSILKMSMITSWFQAKQYAASPSWLPPSDMSNALPSDASRTVSPSASRSSTRSSAGHANKRAEQEAVFADFDRSEAAVRRRLQYLLDAQAEGLLAGIATREEPHDVVRSNARLSSPTEGAKVRPIRQPVKRPMSLRAARVGLSDAMQELASIKAEESDACVVEIAKAQRSYEQAADLESRRLKLEHEIESIEQNEEKEQRERLRSQDAAIQEQIDALEQQLMHLKDQQSTVRLQLTRMTNVVDSKLSSYKESMKLLQSEASKMLRSPPLAPDEHHASYLSLPPKRRTVQMAKEHALAEQQSLQNRQETIEEERQALEAGAKVWNDTIRSVAQFEASLQRSITGLTTNASNVESDSQGDLQDLLSKLDDVIGELDDKARSAEAQGWKLLICCLGAELEALHQGRDMLLGVSNAEQSAAYGNGHEEIESVESATSPAVERSNQLDAPLRNSSSTMRRFHDERQRRIPTIQPNDDEPDPDLLMTARSDTDTDHD